MFVELNGKFERNWQEGEDLRRELREAGCGSDSECQ